VVTFRIKIFDPNGEEKDEKNKTFHEFKVDFCSNPSSHWLEYLGEDLSIHKAYNIPLILFSFNYVKD
jgi:hypothetical protein